MLFGVMTVLDGYRCSRPSLRTRRGHWSALLVGVLVCQACFNPTSRKEAGEETETDVASSEPSEASTTHGGTGDGLGSCGPLHRCAPFPPEGWSGPVARIVGKIDDAAACSGPFPELAFEAYSDIVASPATCSACECGLSTGVQCARPSITLWYGNCSTALSMHALGPHDTCTALENPSLADSVTSEPVLPNDQGTCQASGGEGQLTPPGWTSVVRACGGAQPAGNCGSGICIEDPEAPFAEGACVYREGDAACPSDGYTKKYIQYTAFEDNRGCTPCSCGVPVGAACNAQVEVHSMAGCQSLLTTVTNPGAACAGYPDQTAPSAARLIVIGADGGECAATGGSPRGNVDSAAPITLCCMS